MTEVATLITVFTTLFIIIDPPGLTPMFIALTQGIPASARRAIALRACLIAGALMLVFLFLGEAVLGFVGISMPAFRIAGGVLLFLTALEMLFQRRQARRADTAEESTDDHHDDPSVFPLALPLIVGPGAITSIILYAGQADGLSDYAALVAVMAVVLLCVFVAFMAAGVLERALGKVGLNILTRVLGMLLAALAIQFVIDGIRQSFGLGG